MKNHFYMSYAGNKRNEVKDIYNHIDFENITTIIEPFCGSCAMSYYISTQKQDLKYIFNDNNKYLKEMYEIIIDDLKVEQFENDFKNKMHNIDKDKYIQIINNDNLISWFIKYKVYAIRPGLFPLKIIKNTISLKEFDIYNFFRNNEITFLNIDGIDCYKKYVDNTENLILMDPPYLQCCNKDYYLDSNVNIYEYLYNNNIKNNKALIILILENNWIIKLLFNNSFILKEYNKLYQTSKKLTTHLIIANKIKSNTTI